MTRENHLHGNLFSPFPKLGPGLTTTWPPEHIPDPPLEGLEEDQNLNAKFALSGKQRELLKSGDVENKSTRNEEVLEKRDKLPERIRLLIEDISLLYFRSLLSSEKWEYGTIPEENRMNNTSDHFEAALQYDPDSNSDEKNQDIEDLQTERYETPFDSPEGLWEELLDISIADYFRKDVFFLGTPAYAKETQLGFEIGNILRFIYPNDYNSRFDKQWEFDEEIDGEGLMWGFMLAFLGQPRENIEKERNIVSEFCDLLIDLQEERLQEAKKMSYEDEMNYVPYEESTKEVVEDAGFMPHPIILREVEHHCPIGDDDDDARKGALKKVVKDIEDVTPLREIDRLRRSLEKDMEVIEERSRPGVDSARSVLESVWVLQTNKDVRKEIIEGQDKSDTDDSADDGLSANAFTISSENVGQECGLDKKVVTEVLHRLSDDKEYSLWTDEVVIRKLKTTGNGINWKPTAYGILLCKLCFEYNGEIDILYNYAIGPEEISLTERKYIVESLAQVGYM